MSNYEKQMKVYREEIFNRIEFYKANIKNSREMIIALKECIKTDKKMIALLGETLNLNAIDS